MGEARKYIITCGLGAFAANDTNAQAHFGPNAGQKAQELLAISTERANKAGFELVRCDANPQDPDDTMKRFVETLRSREFVGLNIGFGLRGHKENTGLFEKMLNTAWALSPGIKVMFSNGPQEVITAIQRQFPEDFEST
ncbi:hypothetical protein LTR37_021388 [Vermiconidia calcicola]|uniref:Uncharacterized protein n=1 Tax=Vermiconidia calcicola TaxID=1690605 RepID=A0ACC3M9V5_9PEZI|nr:hypothetical protein LTR37_021388 [Vermiconidia calcicola]